MMPVSQPGVGCSQGHGLPRPWGHRAGPTGVQRKGAASGSGREAHSSSWLCVSGLGRDVVRVEPMQQKVTGMIKGMENQAHEERLKGLLLFSLEKRDAM